MPGKTLSPSAILGRLFKSLGLIVFLFSIATVFDHYHRWIELFSHFKPQYLLGAIFCSLFFLLKRSYIYLGIALTSLAINSFYVLPWYFHSQPVIGGARLGPLKLVHINFHIANTDYQKLIELIHDEKPDILVVQEINDNLAIQLEAIKTILPYSKIAARHDSFGIAMYSRLPLQAADIVFWGPSDLPSIHARIDLGDDRISVVTTHPPPPINRAFYASRNNQLLEISAAIASIAAPVILIGDLNLSMWSEHYRPLIEKTGLFNARRGFGLIPSWPAIGVPFLMIPIDHCLLSAQFSVTDIRAGPDIGSDHLPLIVDLVYTGKS